MKSGHLKILIIDDHVLAPDRDGGSLRMYHLLKMLSALGCAVSYLPKPQSDEGHKAATRVLSSSDVCLPLQSRASVEEYVRDLGAGYDVVILSRVEVAEKYIAQVREHAPHARVWFDSVDLHFVREYREAKLRSNAPLLKRALRTRARELAIVRQSDVTLVVSEHEKKLLARECPSSSIRVISTIYPPQQAARMFSDRRDLLFIGSFRHGPNADAIVYFVQEIYPAVRAAISGVNLYVVGPEPPRVVRDLRGDDIIVTGHVPDLSPFLDYCKISVAPLRFGAGVKSKVLLSLSRGLPVVTSSIGAEGMYLQAGRDVLIADQPSEFAEAVIRLYRDAKLWHELSRQGLDVITRHFSPDAVRANVRELLDSLQVAA